MGSYKKISLCGLKDSYSEIFFVSERFLLTLSLR